jgi:hypothetical protein
MSSSSSSSSCHSTRNSSSLRARNNGLYSCKGCGSASSSRCSVCGLGCSSSRNSHVRQRRMQQAPLRQQKPHSPPCRLSRLVDIAALCTCSC